MLRNNRTSTGLLKRRPVAFAAALALGLGASAAAGDKDPYRMADNTWITISGEVESVDADTFMLDYGDGYVILEMDDGDRVKVTGNIDSDLFEGNELMADSVIKLNR